MKITVFTPTYNRALLLRRLFESLIKQTVYGFEWLVVDDESTDNTKTLFDEINNTNTPFPVRYFVQKHGGKHRAINLALKQAKGSYSNQG